MDTAEELKARGNAAFSGGRFAEAAEHFTDAIALDPGNHILFSNRSAAYASLGQFQQALADAERTVELKPDWAKGHNRLGAARFGLRQWDAAAAAYSQALRLDPGNQQASSGLADVASARAPRAAPAPGGAAAAYPRGGRLAQSALLVAHAAIVAAAVLSLQPFDKRLGWTAFFLGCRAVLLASALKIYLRFGLPALRPFPAAWAPWSRQVAASTELWHLLTSSIMLQTPALWMGLVPLALQAAYPLAAALAARFGGTPLWARYGARGQALLDANREHVSQFVATAEIGMGVQLVLNVLSRGVQGAMMAFVYWSNLRVRLVAPESRPYHQRTWSAINAKAQPLLAAVPALRRYVDPVQRWFLRPGQPPAAHQQ